MIIEETKVEYIKADEIIPAKKSGGIHSPNFPRTESKVIIDKEVELLQ